MKNRIKMYASITKKMAILVILTYCQVNLAQVPGSPYMAFNGPAEVKCGNITLLRTLLGQTNNWNSTYTNDPNAWLFQWNRPADGHQFRTSQTTTTRATTWDPNHGNFILHVQRPNGSYIANLWTTIFFNTAISTEVTSWAWQGARNPCPPGFHVPTNQDFLNANIPLGPTVLPLNPLCVFAVNDKAGHRHPGTGVVSTSKVNHPYGAAWLATHRRWTTHLAMVRGDKISGGFFELSNSGFPIRCMKN